MWYVFVSHVTKNTRRLETDRQTERHICEKERIAYLFSCGCSASKHLAGFGGATMSGPRLLGALGLSILRDPSAAEKGKAAEFTGVLGKTKLCSQF